MKKLLMFSLAAAAVAAGACGTSAADAPDTSEATAPNATAPVGAKAARVAKTERNAGPVYREVTIPAGTTLPLSLRTAIASDTSTVEDTVTADLTDAISIDGRDVLPAGTRLAGAVTSVDESGRVKGRAMIAFRFTSVRAGGEDYDLQSESVSRTGAATKKKDATKIGIGAGAGAVLGGIFGGKKGAAEGAAIGGGAGTGVVLATKGSEVRLEPGADVTSHLTAPLTLRVRVS